MEMLLLGLALSLLGITVSAVLFMAATRDASPADAAARLSAPQLATPRFFAEQAMSVPTSVPIEVLLLQIERHVRLEQAAAEAFLASPTRDSLHSRTLSPLVH
jgi:hypothetical protein